MYNSEDKNRMLFMSDIEVKREIKTAKERMEQYVSYYNEQEKLLKEENPLLELDLKVLFRTINNIEGYIRYAENLLQEWDDNRYINNKRLYRIKLFSLDNTINTDVGAETEPRNRERVSKKVLSIGVVKI